MRYLFIICCTIAMLSHGATVKKANLKGLLIDNASVVTDVYGFDAATRLESPNGSTWQDVWGQLHQEQRKAVYNGMSAVSGDNPTAGIVQWSFFNLAEKGYCTLEYDVGRWALRLERLEDVENGDEISQEMVTREWFATAPWDTQTLTLRGDWGTETVTLSYVTNLIDRVAYTSDVAKVSASGGITTNDVCAIVTNEVSSGWSDWSYTPEIEYFENEEIVSIVPMEWVESGDDPECRFPCWKLQAVTRVQNEVGEVREFESVYYSGYYWKSQGYDDAIVVLATDIACDTRIKATRKPLAKNALGLAMAKDVPTHETVTNVARSVVNSVWDSALGVAWEARMHNGHLYYIAVTNRPPEGK